MAVATAQYEEKTDIQKDITEMVHQFVDEQILPNAEHFDANDEFPEEIVEQMKELGLFGVTIPEEYGGMGLDLTTYTMIVEELSRGWISISGVVNTHFIGSYLLMKFGTDEQKEYFLPKMATGEIRAAFSLSEPEVGSDVQGIKAVAKKDAPTTTTTRSPTSCSAATVWPPRSASGSPESSGHGYGHGCPTPIRRSSPSACSSCLPRPAPTDRLHRRLPEPRTTILKARRARPGRHSQGVRCAARGPFRFPSSDRNQEPWP